MTYTVTFTCTETRANLIGLQVSWALSEMKLFSNGFKEKILWGVKNQYIAEIVMCGVDPIDGCRVVAARLKFDWNRHAVLLNETPVIDLTDKWVDSVAPGIRALVESFCDDTEELGLGVIDFYVLSAAIKADPQLEKQRLAEMGMVKRALPKWKPGRIQSVGGDIRKLDEMSGYYETVCGA